MLPTRRRLYLVGALYVKTSIFAKVRLKLHLLPWLLLPGYHQLVMRMVTGGEMMESSASIIEYPWSQIMCA